MTGKATWICCGLLYLLMNFQPCQPLHIFDSVIKARRQELVKYKASQWDPFLQRLNASLDSSGTSVNSRCLAHMRLFINAVVLREDAGLQLLDSHGSIPAGFLRGSLLETGSHKQCFAADLADETGAPIGRKFCLTVVSPNGPVPEFPELPPHQQEIAKQFALEQSKITVGACYPSVCSNEDIEVILNKVFADWNLSSSVSFCDRNDVPPHKTPVVIICFLGTFVVAVSAATILDLMTRANLLVNQGSSQTNRGSMLARFQTLSLFASFRSTFRLDSGEGERLDIFNGLRVIGVVWVVGLHTYIFMHETFIAELDDFYEMSRTFSRQVLVNSTMNVAVFFTVSGFMQWMAVSRRPLDEYGKASWIVMVLRRYLRMFPLMALVACFHELVPQWGRGPDWAVYARVRREAFPNNWPHYIFGTINLLGLKDMCSPQQWYTAADFQVYSFMLIFTRRLKRTRSIKPFLVLIGLAMLITYAENVARRLGPGHVFYAPLGRRTESASVYAMPYTHVASYCMGIMAGFYYVHPAARQLSKRKVALLWAAALACLGFSLFGTILWTGPELPSQVWTAAFASSARVLFCAVLAWVMFACLTGRAGFLASALGWPGWAPISRLSFSIFMIHDFIVYGQWLSFPSRVSGGTLFMMTMVAGNCAASFGAAFALHALFERPLVLMITVLEDRILPSPRRPSEGDNGAALANKMAARDRGDRPKRL